MGSKPDLSAPRLFSKGPVVVPVLGVILFLTGCEAGPGRLEPAAAGPRSYQSGAASDQAEAGDSADQLPVVSVTLYLPTMTEGGCANSVVGDLERSGLFRNITTHLKQRTCTFEVAPDLDWKQAVAGLAESNDHFRDYEVR